MFAALTEEEKMVSGHYLPTGCVEHASFISFDTNSCLLSLKRHLFDHESSSRQKRVIRATEIPKVVSRGTVIA